MIFNAFFFRHPSRTQILGIHFEEAKNGFLRYLNINTTYNSSIMWNYRQTESAFWTQYLPTVVGRVTPTYPPTTEVIEYYILLNYVTEQDTGCKTVDLLVGTLQSALQL